MSKVDYRNKVKKKKKKHYFYHIVVVYSTLETLCLFKLCYINKVDWIG